MTTFSDSQLRVLAAAIERARVDRRLRRLRRVRPPVSREGAHLERTDETYWARRDAERRAGMIGLVLGLAVIFWVWVLIAWLRG